MPSNKQTAPDRFWSHVAVAATNDCWPWIASCTTSGYGQIMVNGHSMGAHRFSWELHNGVIPAGLCVLHTCDNPSCVNPAHLFLGTKHDNTQDMMRKGRNTRPMYHYGADHHLKRHPEIALAWSGVANVNAKLTVSDVSEIRSAAAAGEPKQMLAERFHVSRRNISYVVNKRTWRS